VKHSKHRLRIATGLHTRQEKIGIKLKQNSYLLKPWTATACRANSRPHQVHILLASLPSPQRCRFCISALTKNSARPPDLVRQQVRAPPSVWRYIRCSAPFVIPIFPESESSTPLFFCSSVPPPWALLLANSCARQRRGFCFPGSSQENFGSLPECSRSLWEQRPSLLGAPRKWGRKRRKNHVLPRC